MADSAQTGGTQGDLQQPSSSEVKVAVLFSTHLMDVSKRTERTIHPGPWWFGQNPIDGQAARALTLALVMKCVTSGQAFDDYVPNAVGKINLSVWRNSVAMSQ